MYLKYFRNNNNFRKKTVFPSSPYDNRHYKKGLHPALRKAFSNPYEHTSSAEGTRHALLDEPTLTFDDAKFMLVSCSAFIKCLVSKASKAGIILMS